MKLTSFFKQTYLAVLIVLAGILSACGSSSNIPTPPPPVNVAPVVDLGADVSNAEKTAVALNATATDSDGSITSFAWTQTAGDNVTLSGADTATLNFDAPIVKQDTVLSFSITVTDNDGATATDAIDVTITPVNELTFTLSGKVTNGAGIASDIVASYENQTINTTSSADGTYTLAIEEDEDFAEVLLFLQSTNTADTHIIFTNVPKSLGELANLAGADAILDESDDISVNLTPLSTALYGMLLLESNAEVPINAQEVSASLVNIDYFDLGPIAAAIKIISENPPQSTLFSGIGLPSDVVDTLELLASPLKITQYLAYVQTNELTTYQSALADIFSDLEQTGSENLTISAPVRLTSTLTGLAQAVFNFNADNTGAYYLRGAINLPFSWTENSDNSYFIEFTDANAPIGSDSFTTIDINGVPTFVRQVRIIREITLKAVLDLEFGRIYENTELIVNTFPDNPGLPEETTTLTSYLHQITDSEFVAFNNDELFNGASSTTLSVPFYHTELQNVVLGTVDTRFGPFDRTEAIGADNVSLSTDGSVVFENLDSSFTNGSWSINSSGSLELAFTTNRTGVDLPINFTLSRVSDNLVVTEIVRDGEALGIGGGGFAINSDNSTFDAASIPGVYVSNPIGLSNPFQDYLWFELNADGTHTFNSVNDQDADGILEQGEVSTETGDWDLTNGVLSIRRYRDLVTNSFTCDIQSPTCKARQERRITFSELSGDKLYTRHELDIRFANTTNTDFVLVNGFVDSRFYDKLDQAPVDLASLPAAN